MAGEARTSTHVRGVTGDIRRRALRARWRHLIIVAVVALVIAAAYAVTVVLYLGAQQPTGSYYAKNTAGAHQLLASVTVAAIDPATNQLTISVDLRPSGSLARPDGITVTRPVHLEVLGVRGPADESANAGDQLTPRLVNVGMNGSESGYPFDAHHAPFYVTVTAPPQNKTQAAVTTMFQFSGVVNGFRVHADATPRAVHNAAVMGLDLTVTRASVTVAFALLMLVLQALLAAAAAAAAILVVRHRWRAETAVLTWLTALLFAIVPLREAMPGSPPIGAEIDVLVFLWAVAIIVFSLVGVFVLWSRRPPTARAE